MGDRRSKRIPHDPAWEHAIATVRCVEQHELGSWLDEPDGIRRGLADIAASHPSLAELAPPPGDPDPALVARWREAPPGQVLDTRWLGDLYQAGSVEARKSRALVQTPRFVSELLMRCALERAYDDFPLVRMIDPSCGTGHLLVDAAGEIGHLEAARRRRDVGPVEVLARVHGVDLDPYCVLIARLRLVLWACTRLQIRRLADVPRDLPIQVACADALLSTTEPLLERGRYEAVLGNPPYIVAPSATKAAIRARYPGVAYRQFSLAAPFEVLIHELAVPGGWTARITTNAFMKREWGSGMISFLATKDLQWVIDCSGAFIPGHGTPTVILVSRNAPPHGDTVTVVGGKRGEPRAPTDPANGLVWSTIRDQVYQREDLDRYRRGEARQRAQRELEESLHANEAYKTCLAYIDAEIAAGRIDELLAEASALLEPCTPGDTNERRV